MEDNPEDTLLFAVESTASLTKHFPWDSTPHIAIALICVCRNKSQSFLLLVNNVLLLLPTVLRVLVYNYQ